jgi:hypothetical protein
LSGEPAGSRKRSQNQIKLKKKNNINHAGGEDGEKKRIKKVKGA